MNFIDEIAPHAQQIMEEDGILSSLIIAQAIHESNWGKSGLAQKGRNLFGVKGSYNGQSVTMPTTEYVNGKPFKVNAAFRKYPSWYESLKDLSNLYKNGVSWDSDKYRAVIGEKDYKKACQAVQKAGYATDPNYANKLINTIEKNGLTKYDAVSIPEESKVDNNKPSKWAEGEWKEACESGYFDWTRPHDHLTREEAAIVINRLRRNILPLIWEANHNIEELKKKSQ